MSCRRITLSRFILLLWVSIFSSFLVAEENVLLSELISIENNLDARIGFFAQDTATGILWAYNADQRFPLSSTFKTLACAALLQRVDDGSEQLSARVSVSSTELVTYSPVLEEYADSRDITLFELCEAAMTTSDNTAANLILQRLGGPESVTSFTRQLGDGLTRLDRWETELNQATPGDDRDTTTPRSMASNFKQLLLGKVLSSESRNQLRTWLISNKVADDLFRSGMPDDWVIGDRTGAGGFGSRSITAVIWPPERSPVFVAFYITETTASFEERNAAVAKLGYMLVDLIQSSW